MKDSMTFMPEGCIEPGIRFQYGFTCGEQLEPSIEIATPYRSIVDGEYSLVGSVMTYKQVDDLIDFLTEQRKNWRKESTDE